MKILRVLLPLIALGFILRFVAPPAAQGQAGYDLVIKNARIYTGDPTLSGDAIAVAGKKIASVGASADLEARCSSPCRTIDAQGAFVMPGFHDSHAHPMSGGAGYSRVQVSGSSIPSIQAAVRRYSQEHANVAWIIGRGWHASGFGTRFPTRQDLDRAESNRPVLLLDSDGHQVWANSAAIRAAGITSTTPDPEGGKILRETDGSPAGVFQETAADLIYDKVPPPNEDERRTYIARGEKDGIEAGVTSFQGGPLGLEAMRTYAKLDQEGKLKQRAFLWADLELKDEDFKKMIEFAHSLPSEGKVHVTAFKGFVDGVISSYTAAMLQPYDDHPESSGAPAMDQAKLNQLVLRANRAGYPVALHSIGDRAVRMSLDAYEFSKRELGHSLVNRVEHIESLDPADGPRFAALGVAASMQPTHMHFGSASSSYYPDRLGAERLKHAFAWKEASQDGALLLFGSDYPVVSTDPIEGMYCAIRRLYGNGEPFEPAQRVLPDAAIQAYTLNPARAIGLENSLGLLRPGFDADLILLPSDPRKALSNSLSSNYPSLMMISGQIVQ